MESLFKEYEGVFEEKQKKESEKTDTFFAYNPFALQDAIGAKDVKKAWIEYQKLRLADISADELVYKVIGKIKEMLSIKLGATKESLNMKSDFPFNKSKKDSKNWEEMDLKKIYTDLVFVFHKSRQGQDLDTSLEKIILSI